jgi:hypothetical protein
VVGVIGGPCEAGGEDGQVGLRCNLAAPCLTRGGRGLGCGRPASPLRRRSCPCWWPAWGSCGEGEGAWGRAWAEATLPWAGATCVWAGA